MNYLVSKYKLLRNFSNIPGWTTKRKIIVIESDDWGSIRMPSTEAYLRLKNAGLNLHGLDSNRYNLNDTLASPSDLEALFETLSLQQDFTGNYPVITAVSVVANPDFQKIEDSGFNEYFFEPITSTLERYYGSEKPFKLWKEGIEKGLFVPQMHGREHLNVAVWLKALHNGHKQTIMAFKEGMWGFVPNPYELPNTYFQLAFLPINPKEIENHRMIIKSGLDLFEQLFGYRAEYFVPPNGPINNSLNKTLIDNGISLRSTAKIQYEPVGNGKTRIRIHYLGQKDTTGIRYITRNCFFEPSQSGKDWVDSCLNDIKIAFYWHKPAIISSHRVNYIGALRTSNRDNGLRKLRTLLKQIINHWPDVEFVTTPRLGQLIQIHN